MRIATWNVARPRPNGWKIPQLLHQKFSDIGADIWILTETHAQLAPDTTYACAHTAHDPQVHAADEYWTMIWSRYPFTRMIKTSLPQLAVCCELQTPLGPCLIYGTVFPDGTAKSWEPHYEAIKAQSQDWKKLRAEFPDHLLCIAGDFNQSRGEKHEYGTNEGRQLLTEALRGVDLMCVTERVVAESSKRGKLQTIDHICLSSSWKERARIGAWPSTVDGGVQLSDHNGVYVDIE